jgi:phospholipid/cholesterol/gamma-HCH transport system substrate-binding protein
MTRSVTAPLVKLLVFAAVTIVLTASLARTLGAFSGGGTTYRARFTDVTGLLDGDDVRIAGVKVGAVTGIRVVDDTVAEVSFTVREDVPLDTGVLARIRYRNLVGQRYMALSEGPGGGQRLHAHGLIPPARTAPALDLTVLFNGFRPLFTALSPEDVNRLSYEIIKVLQGESGTVSSLLARTASLTGTLADRDAVIGRVITNLNAVLSTLDGREGALDQTISQLQQFVSGLSADRDAIGAALADIGALTAATGSLLGDGRPAIAADVAGLRDVAGNLNANAATLDRTLAGLPGRYTDLTRVASYGSWFNFYLCDFDGRVGLAGQPVLDPPAFDSPAVRCATGGAA